MNAAKFKVAYLTTCFPNQVDTFVRREMQSLPARELSLVAVCSLRQGAGQLDPADPPLLQAKSGPRELLCFLWWAVRRPIFFARLLRTAFLLDRREIFLLKQGHSSFIKSILLLPRLIDIDSRLDNQVQHLHAQFAGIATTAAFLLAQLRGITFSFTAHGSDIFVYPPQNLRLRLACCAFCVTVSDYGKQYLLNEYGQEFEDKIHVVRCGIQTELYLQLRREPCATPPRFLTVALLSRVKGIDVFLRALACYRAKGGNPLEYHIVGDGPERTALQTDVQELGLADWVTFHGLQGVDGVRAQLQGCDIFVLPSRSEGFPVSLMEAAAAGLPLLASQITGIPEILQAEVNGIFLTPDNVAQQAGQLARLSTADWSLLRQLKSQAFCLDVTSYDVYTSALQLERLFKIVSISTMLGGKARHTQIPAE
jgi:colanic acid/amylovoran biosynthesis glycosyltransferase